ncbi:MAG: acetyl-CoA carboxylase biotin carboxylase subunit [Proteobacteria bacterium]|nr:acetyl-CoA carboxylase biotin carboxylase subunit [Pseudomonadota bacterium]
MSIKSLLIANRGEIAVRIIRAAKELGIRTIQVYSDADSEALAVRMADEAINIGPAQAAKSYLKAEAILDAAKSSGADAVHPGYGFFSENADFADAVVEAGMVFVGPDGDTIRMMGDKVSARKTAAAAGVPTVPGSPGRMDDMEEAREIILETGFPAMIKAAAGGGGRGIRIIDSLEEFDRLAPQASAEALAAFGDGGLYIEKVIKKARHIEVQVMGDGDRAVHFFERDCSLQRRRQKVWEEAPAQALNEEVRQKLCASAVSLAESVKYRGAGTVEYLYDEVSNEYYFIEMNTRIQVEHPVTEMITGVDLMREMIEIAGGKKLSLEQENIGFSGHAIEVRLNAEDPAANFMPHPGIVQDLTIPGGPGVRFDGSIYSGFAIPPYYDSLLGKLLVWDETREQCIDRLKRALQELQIGGVKTTKPLFQVLSEDEEIRRGDFDTNWLEKWLTENIGLIKSQEGSEQ